MLSDRERVQRALVLDDRAAYGDLVRKYQVEIRTYLTRLTRNKEAADDLAQESFLHGYRHLAQLADGAKFRPWLFAIAHTQFLQWWRRRKDTSSELPETGGGEARVSARVEVESLLKALRPEERSAMILCLGHDFTHAEAAATLGLPLGTVKSLILRARQKLGGQHGVE